MRVRKEPFTAEDAEDTEERRGGRMNDASSSHSGSNSLMGLFFSATSASSVVKPSLSVQGNFDER